MDSHIGDEVSDGGDGRGGRLSYGEKDVSSEPTCAGSPAAASPCGPSAEDVAAVRVDHREGREERDPGRLGTEATMRWRGERRMRRRRRRGERTQASGGVELKG